MKIAKYLPLFFLLSCGFSSNYYKEIIKAQDLITDKKYAAAADIYKRVLKQKLPKVINIKVHYQLAEIYSTYLENYTGAEKLYLSLLEISHEPSWHIKSKEKLGEIYFKNLKNYPKAYRTYQQLSDFRPYLEKRTFYQYNGAKALLKMKKYGMAIEEFKKIILSKDTALANESFHYLGLCYFYQRKWDLAVKSWFTFLKTSPEKNKEVMTKFLIANAYENNEKLKKAYNMYYSLLGKYPNNDLIKKRLESLYNRRVARKR